jgi:hypothetical protein
MFQKDSTLLSISVMLNPFQQINHHCTLRTAGAHLCQMSRPLHVIWCHPPSQAQDLSPRLSSSWLSSSTCRVRHNHKKADKDRVWVQTGAQPHYE